MEPRGISRTGLVSVNVSLGKTVEMKPYWMGKVTTQNVMDIFRGVPLMSLPTLDWVILKISVSEVCSLN